MKRRAVFLDRDGTINKEVDVLRDVRKLSILQGAPEAIRVLNKLGFLVIVVTNQPVIARGWLSEEEVEEIHRILASRLARRGARIDAIYYCPHHPEANLKRYRKKCRCRKPGVGLIERAVREHRINLKNSFMVGDHAWDIIAGKRAGLTTILVNTSGRSRDSRYAHIQPDFAARNLKEAASIIRKHAK